MRTAGSIELKPELKPKRASRTAPLPRAASDVTGLQPDGPGNPNLQIRELTGPDDARQTVPIGRTGRDLVQGAYKNITARGAERRGRARRTQARSESHGHLCSVTYPEAVEIGIDTRARLLRRHGARPRKEAGFLQRQPGRRHPRAHGPRQRRGESAHRIARQAPRRHDLDSARSRGEPPGRRRVRGRTAAASRGGPGGDVAVRARRLRLLAQPARQQGRQASSANLSADMDLSAFVAAGGLLLAGADPCRQRRGDPGLRRSAGDRAAVVEAGFSRSRRSASRPERRNLPRPPGPDRPDRGREERGPRGREGRSGRRIADIENVEIVFGDGVGYDRRSCWIP